MPGRILSAKVVSGSDSASISGDGDESSSGDKQLASVPSSPGHKRKRVLPVQQSIRHARIKATTGSSTVVQDSDSSASDSEGGGTEDSTSRESRCDDETVAGNSINHSTSKPHQPLQGADLVDKGFSSHEEVRKPYECAPGFLLASASSNINSSSTFSSTNLQNKQLWHFTAPTDLPLDAILEVDLATLEREGPVMRHNGMEYYFTPSRPAEAKALHLMVPVDSGQKYKAVKTPFAQSFNLQTTIRSSSYTFGEGGQAHTATAVVRHARPQPEGLRTRYWPMGFEP